ncbi:HEAT repeat domain-containing protein [Rhodocytophaga rosea]|uniref:HEAT repeat domain-containing protein n=1 Tax=Rhodocytophaga rosea TaxID=2704465 RepID=A0A6C0GVG6_9BACT|nr:HEAT repeat domain-containing protein [Rhodocytophaga rosea]QHT72006.1 HEAT repeat domain-containing protein [Rhodocytophaga rosea]
MKCEKMMYLMVLYLNGELNDIDKLSLESHLSECQSCKQELMQMQLVHRHMAAIPVAEPDAIKMRADFNDMLYEYKRATVQARSGWLSSLREKIAEVWQPVYAMQLLTGILLLLMGWAGGYWFSPQRTETQQISQLALEVQQMRETMLLTMLEKPAATERLKAVNYTQNLDKVDEKVIQALLQTLNNDPNVNVRLVTVETLSQLASYASVREGLIQAIPQQESPLVQIALADVMVNLQEKRSVSALRNLLKQENLNASVKSKLEQSVKVLM